MSDFENEREQRRQEREQWREERRNKWRNRFDLDDPGSEDYHIHKRKWTGIFILLIGIAALLKASLTEFPDWIFTWPMLLIALGVFSGLRHNFRGVAWFILIIVGGVFLIRDVFPDIGINRYIWPVAIIFFGLFLLSRPRRRRYWDSDNNKKNISSDPIPEKEHNASNDDYVIGTSIFGGTKKIIISKNFRGGDLVSIFGGTEIDLSQADFNDKATIEITTIFGGTKLLVPSNWSIKSEVVTILGGIEDKRRMQTITEAPQKTLVLRGTVIFGGIDIKSF